MCALQVPALWPPPRPTTVPLALQQSMPLAQVLSVMAKPPGSAPPFVPWKPVPRLVPLPGSHTLTVARPELRDAASYGNLRSDNLQLSITAQVRGCTCVRMLGYLCTGSNMQYWPRCLRPLVAAVYYAVGHCWWSLLLHVLLAGHHEEPDHHHRGEHHSGSG